LTAKAVKLIDGPRHSRRPDGGRGRPRRHRDPRRPHRSDRRAVADAGGQEIDVAGKLVIPGLVESHFHLDKALLGAGAPADAGSVAGAIRATAAMKRRFTRDDIQARARRALELAVRHGTTAMRTHVEVDPIVGLAGMEAILPLQREYAWAIDLQIGPHAHRRGRGPHDGSRLGGTRGGGAHERARRPHAG
jgi:cytosine/adenosine deaminase-related metal-dependent hydrolase